MASAFSIPPFSGGGRRETLAGYLAAGPPGLTSALHCATAIACALRALHEEGHSHGLLTPGSVLLSDSGILLEPAPASGSPAPLHQDVQAFGAILNELMIRSSGTSAARTAGAKLAGKCMAATNESPGILTVLAEVRRLYGLALQNDGDPLAEQVLAVEAESPPAPSVPETPAEPAVAAPVERSHPPEPPVPQPVVPLQPANFARPLRHIGPEAERAAGNCPKCDSLEVYVSRPRSRFEEALVRWKLPLYRCHRCYHRWLEIWRMKIAKDMPIGTSDRSFKRARKPHRRH